MSTLPTAPVTGAHAALPAQQDHAADPGDTTAPATSPATGNDDQAVGLREAHEYHLPEITFAALRYARANDPAFPGSVDKRGAELLNRVGVLKRWARNRPRAAVGAGLTGPGLGTPRGWEGLHGAAAGPRAGWVLELSGRRTPSGTV
ncbi:hypothetical protein [Streptomyces mirabilis]|uniref:Uncharacterized protein n=1 Tax=Streptomyces mirabilis TaxID=68239 RepID=A0ABU3V5X2_9ACTN|nr:hypothetical protein [Streptomyces mirabilis]MCX5357034.1 hypothetical protein [Streptomyces mirabilis]MDU9001571.1 hypothetical protein [Streptomyces mirabilis]